MAVPLDAEALLAVAQAETGLSDWGDPSFRERFAQAVDLIRSANMDDAGEAIAAANCTWLLTDRLRFFDDHKRHELDREVIEQPMFVTGEPRSGTTLLHALLSVDPDARALRFWEVMHPSPPPGLAGSDDPRRAQSDVEWREINARLPNWLKSHPYNDMLGDGLPECERTWAFDFRVLTPTAWWRVPMGMVVGGIPSDPPAQYRIHKMMLQAIQHGRPRKKWVLKGFHATRFPAFFEAYPDARILYIHRDPVQSIASRIQMAADLTEGLTGSVDIKAIAELHTRLGRAGFKATLDNPMIDDPRIHHVRYQDFVADQVGVIRKFYDFAGHELTAEAEAAMRNYLATNRGDRYGKFRYSTDLVDGDVDALHAEFAPYRERFGLDIEQRG
ncbi:sulfotransferase [Sphingomonas sp. LaA6.9]|uniref:sulfotransferase family protein n=1 Tax=Sphingomonas sp. LaA6.9 TaxID=2919914 RepID=UPI001F503D0E|nr:sulfotransferase [Sphingomonas sp. LaA6.9]MCJ8156135.1 sulfotransferase [Sphingomonas sp. LaA6.9]